MVDFALIIEFLSLFLQIRHYERKSVEIGIFEGSESGVGMLALGLFVLSQYTRLTDEQTLLTTETALA